MKHLIARLAGPALLLSFALGSGGAAMAAGDVPLGDDGLHKPDWVRETFKDLAEDHAEAAAEGKVLMVIFEQRGCIYCTRMHEEVFTHPEIEEMLREEFFVVQLNLFGDVEVTDFDGERGSEKAMARKWGILFTPTLMFFPPETEGTAPAPETAVATMPGAFGVHTTRNLLRWISEGRYDGEEVFQKYHARMLEEDPVAE